MMRSFLLFFFFLTVSNGFSQDIEIAKDTSNVKVDSLYREDQFYFGFTFNSLKNKPQGLSQGSISTGFSLGFLRDMPINKDRTIAFATGLGLSYTSFNQNLAITKQGDSQVYTIINGEYNKNKFSQFFVEMPLEFRWRTSTPQSFKFWRLYTGIKFSYLLNSRSLYDSGTSKVILKNNPDFNDISYGAYLSAGYNTWNVYLYYGLNPIFKSAKINNELIKMNALSLGLIFYIL